MPVAKDGNNDEGNGNAPPPPLPAPDISHIIIERQQREIETLREQRKKSLGIEITGEGGSPVYASGSIEHGDWRATYGGLWDAPDLEMTDEFNEKKGGSSIPISELEGIEIYVGGVFYASATSHPVEIMMYGQDWDHDTGKELVCHYGGQIGVWLPLRISGWPWSDWEAVMRDMNHLAMQNDQDFDVYHFF